MKEVADIADKLNTKEIINLLKMGQSEVKKYVTKVLRNYGYRPVSAKGFVYAEGTVDVGLIAHMDTVGKKPPKWVNTYKGIMSNPANDYLGADDRAGVYAILHLIKRGYRPTVIFTEDEEIGCVGATLFSNIDIDHNLKYLIELDRKGKDDAVFYDCHNDEFTKYIEEFGFVTNYGSCSDISVIAPVMGICAVNLSVGYYDQHTNREILVLDELLTTINKVSVMLNSVPDEAFDYMARIVNRYDDYGKGDYAYDWSERYSYYDSHTPLSDMKVPTANTSLSTGIELSDCWLNVLNLDDLNGDVDNLTYLDGGEGYYIDESDNVYDINGIRVDAIIFNDNYQQLFHTDFYDRVLTKSKGDIENV